MKYSEIWKLEKNLIFENKAINILLERTSGFMTSKINSNNTELNKKTSIK